jgi:hypothetical protein
MRDEIATEAFHRYRLPRLGREPPFSDLPNAICYRLLKLAEAEHRRLLSFLTDDRKTVAHEGTDKADKGITLLRELRAGLIEAKGKPKRRRKRYRNTLVK